MKKSAGLIILICFFFLVASEAGAGTVFVLSSQDEKQTALLEAFRSGFSEDFNIINLDGSEKRMRETGEILSASPPDLLLVSGNMAAQMAKWYLEGVPVIYCSASRVPAIGLKGSNVYGIFHAPSLEDQFAALVHAFPDKKKVGILYSKKLYEDQIGAMENEISARGIELVKVGVSNIKEVPAKTREVVGRADLLWVVEDPELVSPHSFSYITLLSIQHGIPVFSGSEVLASRGATAALIEDSGDTGLVLAEMVQKVLSGGSPSSNIVFPGGRLILNSRTASIMNINFSQDMINEADRIIE